LDDHVGRLIPDVLPPPDRERRRTWLGGVLRAGATLLVLALLIGGGALLWQAIRPVPPTRPREVPQAVRTAPVVPGDMPITFNALGTVTPLATVTVRTQIAGQLQQIGFTEGQMVKKGDFLAQVDPRPYQVALEQAQGQLAHDQGLLAQARSDLIRYQTLTKQDSISRQQVDDQVFLVQQYQGTVAADQGTIDTAKLNLTYCHIVAPVDGRVGLRQVDQGNYVQLSDTNGIVVITQLQPMSVLFTLPEDQVPAVMKRLAAGASLPVAAYDRANTTQLASGTLLTVDNQVDTTTGTVKLRASFSNTDLSLFPSQFVNARLLVDTVHGALLVPSAAVQRGAPGTYVYMVAPDSTVKVVPVKLGPADAENTVITTGLKAGERVVIDGADRLRDGAKVNVTNATDTPIPTEAAPRRHRRAAEGEGARPNPNPSP
jgi:multidrug efflux system membrane fusion protein